MKEKKILPLVLSMALPMIISMAVNSLYNIIDSFFVAKVSENAMTALSLVYPIQNLVNSIAVGFGVGINAVVAFHLGAGEMQNADRATTYGLFLSFIHGLILTVFSIRYAVLRKNVHNRYRCYQSCRNVLNYRVFIFNNSKCRHSI